MPVNTWKGYQSIFSFRRFEKIRGMLALERNVIVLGFTSALATFGNSLWYFFLPIYMRDMAIGLAQIGMIYTAGNFLGFFVQPIGGYMTDRLGRKKTIIIGNLIYTVSLGFFSLINKAWMVLPVYMLFKIGSEFSSPATKVMLTESVPETKRGTAVGTFYTLAPILAIFGPPLGGILLKSFNYNLLFFISFLLGIIMTIIRHTFLKETVKGSPTSFRGWSSFKATISKYSEIFKNRNISFFFITFGFYRFAIAITEFLIPLYSENQLKLDTTEIGILFSVPSVANLTFSLPAGKITDKIGKRKSMILGLVGRSLFLMFFILSKSWLWAILAFYLMIIFDILTKPASVVWIANVTDSENRGMMMGLFYTFTLLFTLPGPIGGASLYAVSPIYPFFANILLCILAMIILVTFTSESSEHNKNSKQI